MKVQLWQLTYENLRSLVPETLPHNYSMEVQSKSPPSSSSSSSMDGMYILLDPPNHLEFGIDCMNFELGPHFKGISLIPPGLHFIYHANGVSGGRQGYFINMKSKDELIIHRWDSYQEEIVPSNSLSTESIDQLTVDITNGALNSNLGPYPIHQHHVWKNISCFISNHVLERSGCKLHSIIVPGNDDDIDMNIDMIKLKNAVEKNDKKMKTSNVKQVDQSSTIYPPVHCNATVSPLFVNIHGIEMTMVEHIQSTNPQSGRAITEFMMDKSSLLQHLLQHHYHNSHHYLLGEMQLSFLLFIFLYSYPALKQWKAMVYLISSSEQYLHEHQDFTSTFMKTLYSQLNFTPTEFFENELSTNNFLRPIFTSLLSSLSSSSNGSIKMTPSMLEHKKRFMRFLEKKFNLLIPTAAVLLHTHHHSPIDSIDDVADVDATGDYRVATIGEGWVSVDPMHVIYTEEDLYTIDEEDLPTFVSMDEINQYYTENSNVADSNHDNVINSDINKDDNSSLMTIDHSDGQRVSSSSRSSRSSDVHMRWGHIDRMLEQSIATGDKPSVDLIAVTDNSYNEEHRTSAVISMDDGVMDREKQHAVHVAHPPPPSVIAPVLTSMEKEKLLFSWRYPLIYASMELSNGSEDMTMAAMRILDEYGSSDDASIDISMDSNDRGDDEAKGNKYRSASNAARGGDEMRYQEAMRFIEFEVARTR